MMKRTEKSTANSRQKSIANSRQDKSRANSRQGKQKGLRPRQGEVRGELRGETQYRRKLQSASPEASKDRCRCPGGAMGAEA